MQIASFTWIHKTIITAQLFKVWLKFSILKYFGIILLTQTVKWRHVSILAWNKSAEMEYTLYLQIYSNQFSL